MRLTASPYRLVAVALAFVLVTSVALPSVAHACGMMKAESAMITGCCPAGDDGPADPAPCHGDAPKAPVGDLAEMACCKALPLAASHEAALTKEASVPAAAPLASDLRLPPADPQRPFPLADCEAPVGGGPGLFLLHGALLN